MVRPLQDDRSPGRQVSLLQRYPERILSFDPVSNNSRFSEQYTNVHFVKLDVDEVPDVAQELGIRAMPTFLIFKDGEKFDSVLGVNPRGLVDVIEKAIAA